MKIAIISFSSRGEMLAEKIAKALRLRYADAEAETASKSKYAKNPLEISHQEWTKQRFADSDGIIFIGACGIAVRSIAPFVKSKKTDPAVLVADDTGKFVISLLSGHLGGGNELARTVAEIIDAQPVITTATDNNGKLSPDLLAQRNDCVISDFERAKELAAAILENEPIGIYCGSLAEAEVAQVCGQENIRIFGGSECGMKEGEDERAKAAISKKGIVISPFERDKDFFSQSLWLIPRCAAVGIGCKKGTEKAAIEAAFERVLKESALDIRAVAAIASIDLKASETGLLEFCSEKGLELLTFGSDELSELDGDFSKSEFVKGITGVDNVCERSAVLAASKLAAAAGEECEKGETQPELIVKKCSGGGVTAAVAVKKRRIRIEL